MRARRRWLWLLLILLFTLRSSLARAQSAIQYVYDELGRLIAVIDTNGDSAVYHYDAVGNILSIDRHSASTVAIITFTPSTGPVGTTVIISGTGFSSTPSQNTVTFNGTAARVTSASATQLVVTVPAGAATGAIGVTAPNGSATSSGSFTVGALNAPSITSFSPAAGVAGTAVTISGTNFDTTAGNDRTQLNSTFVTLSGATTTSLTTSVPANAGSGHLAVSTPYGTAVSTDDFIVPPSPYVPADVDNSSRIAFATATTVSVSTANKIALRLFDTTAAHRVSLVGTNGMTGHVVGCDVLVGILDPYNGIFAPGTCMEGSGFIDATTVLSTGTYAIDVDPTSTVTGSVTLTLYDVPANYAGTITPGGSSQTVSTTTPGQNGAVTFTGTAGQRVSLEGKNGTIAGKVAGCDVNVSILNPDSSTLAPATCMEVNGFIDVQNLSTTGTYAIVVDPVSTSTGNLPLTLYDVPADFSDTITAGGSAKTVSTTTPGQNAVLTFTGTGRTTGVAARDQRHVRANHRLRCERQHPQSG